MRKFGFWLLVFMWSLFVGCLSLAHGDYVPGEVLVKFKPGVIGMSIKAFSAAPKAADIRAASIKELSQKFGVSKIERIYYKILRNKAMQEHIADYYRLSFLKEKDVLEFVAELKKNPNVILAQPNFIYRAFKTVPNDPEFGNQWGLTKIRADNAWDKTTGSSAVVIAVLDTGADYNHEDLQGRIDTVNDYDYVNDDDDAMDDDGHGTSVAGVIGATADNAVGIAGVDWQAKILPLKVLYPAPGGAQGDTLDITSAIRDAHDRGADIINMSFGMPEPVVGNDDVLMQEAVDEAFSEGCVLVAAAGNTGEEIENYPAANNHVLAVAATDQNDKRSVWNPPFSSNYGSWVDVSAPGTDIYTTVRGGGYSLRNGTSFSTPFVAGLAGLVKAANPGLTNQEIMDEITREADNIDSLNPGYEGKLGKRINAYLAIAGIIARINSPESGTYVKGTIDVYGSASGWDFNSYILEALQNGSLIATIETSTISVEGGKLGSWDTTGINGEYDLKLQVFSTGSATAEADQVTVFVDNIPPEAEISFPQEGADLSGKITIVGTAEDQYLEKYILEYGQGTAPSSFEKIKESYISVDSGILGTWETSGLNGQYTIKLSALDKVGTSVSNTILVNLQNTIPPIKEAESQPGLPLTFTLPNPFNRTVTSEITFNYILAGNFNTKIYLFDLSGNLIWQNSYSAGENGGKSGTNNPIWAGKDISGADVSNGVYLYQIIADQKVIARGKIIILN